MGDTARLDAGQQHLQALERANRVRLARAELKRRVAAADVSAAEVVLSCPWEAHSMSISDLLMSQRRWGRARCKRILMSIQVPENKTVGSPHRAPAPRTGGHARRDRRAHRAHARRAVSVHGLGLVGRETGLRRGQFDDVAVGIAEVDGPKEGAVHHLRAGHALRR